MGMTIYDALVIAEVVRYLPRKNRVLTLGVPTLNFQAQGFAKQFDLRNGTGAASAAMSTFTTAADFFRAIGFEQVDALDISDYEGANIVEDLNDPDLVRKVGRRYDLVYDSGTIEHIFDIVAAIRAVHALVDIGGAVIHATPTNGFTDHGFWQVSPDLFRAAYASSGYRLLTSAFFVFGSRPYVLPARENVYRTRGRSFIMQYLPETVAVFAAQKLHESPMEGVKLQAYYQKMHEGGDGAWEYAFHLPFGSPAVGVASRGRMVGGLLMVKDRLRSLARTLIKGPRR